MKLCSAIKTDLFADEQRSEKIDTLGEPRAAIESHIGFAALAVEIDWVVPRLVSQQDGRPPYPTETLLKQGFIARGGQMIDAPLVPAPKQHNSRSEKELLDQGALPAGWKPAKRRQKDLDTIWTKKHGKSHHGYKLSIKCYKVIRNIETNTASAHDSQHFEMLLDSASTNRNVFADKGTRVGNGRKTSKRLATATTFRAMVPGTIRFRNVSSGATGGCQDLGARRARLNLHRVDGGASCCASSAELGPTLRCLWWWPATT